MKIKFYYEILYRKKGDNLTIYTAEVTSRNSIEAEEAFKTCPLYSDCELLDVNMLKGSYICE